MQSTLFIYFQIILGNCPLCLIVMATISVQASIFSHLEKFNILSAGLSAFTTSPAPHSRERCLLHTNQVCSFLKTFKCSVIPLRVIDRDLPSSMNWVLFLVLLSFCVISLLLPMFQTRSPYPCRGIGTNS